MTHEFESSDFPQPLDDHSHRESRRCPTTGTATDELSDSLCAALRAMLRTEMELARQEQAEAAARHEERTHQLLLLQEQRLRMVMLQTALAARGATSKGTGGAGTSPSAGGSLPLRRRELRHKTWHTASVADAGTSSPAGAVDCHRSRASLENAELRLPIQTVRLPVHANFGCPCTPLASQQSPVAVSGNLSQRSLGTLCASLASRSPAVSAVWTGRTPTALRENRLSPCSVDMEASATPVSQGAAKLTRATSLNSRSPAGALEWRHHVRRQITSKMSRGNRYVRSRNIASFLGRKISMLNTERLEAFMSTLSWDDPAAPKRWSERVVDSMGFEMLCGMIIFANAAAIGWQQDTLTRAAMGDIEMQFCDTCFDAANTFLIMAFLVEIMFRLFAKRCKYFFGKEWKWNVLDIVLATYSISEFVAFRTYHPYFQIIRTLRLVRVVRATRSVRVFRDLRLMICSLSQSLVSLFSALVLLFAVIYLFSICFMYAAATYVQDGGQAEVMEELKANYGNLNLTMFTLLLAISNGADWKQLAAPLAKIHWGFEVLFIVYVLFVVIGVLNVLTSSFVERARELSKLDRDLATQGELASQEAFLAEMRTIFEEVDDDKDGRITWHKFRDYLKSEQAQAFFATQQLDTSDAARLFSLLDVDATGAVQIEEFALGCMRLRGPAKSSDVAALLKEAKIQRKCAKQLNRMSTKIDGLCSVLFVLDPHSGSSVAGPAPASAVSRATSRRCGSARHAQIAI